jgi:hypothetical protein
MSFFLIGTVDGKTVIFGNANNRPLTWAMQGNTDYFAPGKVTNTRVVPESKLPTGSVWFDTLAGD